MGSMTGPTFQLLGPCPCGLSRCDVVGTKLSKYGHLTGCKCPSCLGRRVRRKGQAGQAMVHRDLGGDGPTPSEEKSARAYPVRVRPETKRGAQVPASFLAFVESEKWRQWIRQAATHCRVGDGTRPSVALVLPGGGRYLVVELRARGVGA